MATQDTQLSVALLSLSVRLAIYVSIFVPLERLFAVHPHKFFRKGFLTDLAYYYINSLLPVLLMSLPMAALALMVRHLVPQFVLNFSASLPLWARMSLAMVVSEMGYYWAHRLCHEVPFLWRFHSIHHSAEEMDFLVSSRAHPFDMVFGKFCSLVPIYMLGLVSATESSGLVLTIMLIGMIWGYFIHANIRWKFGPLEWLVSTPHFHHWHHTLSGPINKNYSSNFPWIDALFGSLHLPKAWPADYGCNTIVPPVLVDQIVFPFFKDEANSPAPASEVSIESSGVAQTLADEARTEATATVA